MNAKTIILYGLSIIALIIALVIFFKWALNIKAILFLLFGIAAVLLFRQAVAESKKQKK